MRLRRALTHALITSLSVAGMVLITTSSALADPPSGGEPATVTVTPAAAVNDVGTSHTVTATVRDADGSPVPGPLVQFFVNGSEGPGASGCIALEPDGQCPYTYQGPDLPRTDVITACVDTDANGDVDPGEPCGTATKAWVVPATTAGHVTGGGQAPNASGTDVVTFGFNAKGDRKGVKGNCTLVDQETDTKIKCLDVTSLVQSGDQATFFGNATVDGVPTTYRIDIEDNGEPGRTDVFRIETASGYVAGGVIERGNIQVH